MLIYFFIMHLVLVFFLYIPDFFKEILHLFEIHDKILESIMSQSKGKIQIKQNENEKHSFFLCGMKGVL